MYNYRYVQVMVHTNAFGIPYIYAHIWGRVATIIRLLKMIGLFCRIQSLLQGSFVKQTYHFKEPTNRSHLIVCTITLYASFVS